MNTQTQKDIIARVKETLGIVNDIEISDLYEQLSHAMSESHPDKYSDLTVKKQAEERFKTLNNLREEFKSYIETERLNHQMTIANSSSEYDTIDKITKATETELELLSVKKQLQIKDWDVKCIEQKLIESETKYSRLVETCSEKSKEKIKDIYKPQKYGSIIGIGSAFASLSVLMPQVQQLLSTLGIGGRIGISILITTALLWIFRLIRNFLSNVYIESLIDKTIVGTDLMTFLNVKVTAEKYPKAYFTENDVVNLVEHNMSGRYIKILLYGSYNSVKRSVVEYIILELERKHFIKETKTNDLVKLFYIEHKESANTDFSF